MFYTNSRKNIVKGWRKVENLYDISPQNLSAIKKGDKIAPVSVDINRGLTPPPSRFTEGTLLEAMSNPVKYMKDRTLKASLNAGLGTPATRGEIKSTSFLKEIRIEASLLVKDVSDSNATFEPAV